MPGAAGRKGAGAKTTTAASAHADEVARRNAAQDDVVVAQIREAATEVHRDILKKAVSFTGNPQWRGSGPWQWALSLASGAVGR